MKHTKPISTVRVAPASLLETEQKITVTGGVVALVSEIFGVLDEIRTFFKPEEEEA